MTDRAHHGDTMAPQPTVAEPNEAAHRLGCQLADAVELLGLLGIDDPLAPEGGVYIGLGAIPTLSLYRADKQPEVRARLVAVLGDPKRDEFRNPRSGLWMATKERPFEVTAYGWFDVQTPCPTCHR